MDPTSAPPTEPFSHLHITPKVDWFRNQPFFSLAVTVDGEPLVAQETYYAVDPLALQASLGGSGQYYIITSADGMARSAGIHQGILVHHEADARVVWEPHTLTQTRYVFEQQGYREAVETGIAKAESLLRENPNVTVVPSGSEIAYKVMRERLFGQPPQ